MLQSLCTSSGRHACGKGEFVTFEIRPIKADELEAFNHNVRTVFASGGNMHVDMPLEWTLCGFEDGRLATSYAFWPLTILLNGAPVPIAGVTMVGTYPLFRRKGYLRKVTTRHFEIMHEQGERHISALFASRTAIYQRYGYGVVSGRYSYNIDPRDIQLLNCPNGTGVMKEATQADESVLLALYHRFISGRNGYLRREDDYFRIPGSPYGTYMPPEVAARLVKIVYHENGKPAGYVVYGVEQDMRPGITFQGHLMNIAEMAWLTPTAYQGIWSYLGRFDLVNQISARKMPPDDPLMHLLLEPKRLEVTVPSVGLLARIVDLEKALPLRPYAAEGTLSFEVRDELCPWNNGCWEMETGTEGASVRRSNKGTQVTMPVSTLAMLVFGRISASEAARMGRLDTRDAKALALWDRVMKTEYEPYCADSF